MTSSDPSAPVPSVNDSTPTPGPTQSQVPIVWTATTSVASTVVGAVPLMLVGALSVLMRDDIRFDEAALGTGVAVYFLVAAISSMVGGRVAERLRARTAVRLGLLGSALALGMIAGVAARWWHVVAALVVAGMATGILHPAVNIVLARQVRAGLQGLFFGLKQSAVPGASMLAGFSVVVFGGVGWRWAFVTVAAIAVLLTASVPNWPESGVSRRRGAGSGTLPVALVVLASIGGALASAAANAMSIFFVLSATAAGVGVAAAANLLVVGALSGIVARIVVGAAAGRVGDDRPGWHFGIVAVLVGVGAVGYLLMASATSVAAIAAAAVITFGAGWGWPGVMLLGVVRVSPEAPGTASGVVQGATFLGAVFGPASFGWIVTTASYTAGWYTVAVAAAVGAVFVALAARLRARTVRAQHIDQAGRPHNVDDEQER